MKPKQPRLLPDDGYADGRAGRLPESQNGDAPQLGRRGYLLDYYRGRDDWKRARRRGWLVSGGR